MAKVRIFLPRPANARELFGPIGEVGQWIPEENNNGVEVGTCQTTHPVAGVGQSISYFNHMRTYGAPLTEAILQGAR